MKRITVEEGAVRKVWVNAHGYYSFKYKGKCWSVHRWLAEKHINKPEGADQVNHIDGDKLNNNLSNLEWVSHRDNLYHAMDTGLHAWGRIKLEATNKITKDTVVYLSQAEAARDLNIHQGNISKCLSGLRKSAGGYTFKEIQDAT